MNMRRRRDFGNWIQVRGGRRAGRGGEARTTGRGRRLGSGDRRRVSLHTATPSVSGRPARSGVRRMTRRLPRLIAAGLALALAAPALAHEHTVPDLAEPISLRMEAMKQVGAAMGVMGAMAKGETEFEPRAAEMALRAVLAAAVGYGGLFPEGSETGMMTEAAPAIWSDRAGFDAKLAKFIDDAHGAVKAPPADLDGLRAAMGAVGANCRSCHTDYRISRQ